MLANARIEDPNLDIGHVSEKSASALQTRNIPISGVLGAKHGGPSDSVTEAAN